MSKRGLVVEDQEDNMPTRPVDLGRVRADTAMLPES